MKLKWLLFLLGLALFLFILSACNMPDLPTCATEALRAPALLGPDDGTHVDSLTPSLTWKYLDPCNPQGYRIDLSVDPAFADTSLSGGTGNPSTSWGPGEPLDDCSTYFWRVAPINDVNLGPFSDVFVFYTDVHGCTADTSAAIQGTVWFDQCSLPLDTNPVPDPLPEGCAVTVYDVDADGIHQPAEPFMPNLDVHIADGDCPASGPKSALTMLDGTYQFSLLRPGKYCLNMDAASFVGPGGTGHWTLIPSGHEGNTYRRVLVGHGQTLTAQDFAWYRYVGPTPTPVSTFTPTPVPTHTPTLVPTDTPTAVPLAFIPDMNVNCRLGTDTIFPIVDVAMKGTSYLLDGKNGAGTYYRIMLDQQRGCWVPAKSGQVVGDISKLRTLISPFTPTFTPVPTFTPTTVPVVCSAFLDEKSCELNSACYWATAVTGAGNCLNK